MEGAFNLRSGVVLRFMSEEVAVAVMQMALVWPHCQVCAAITQLDLQLQIGAYALAQGMSVFLFCRAQLCLQVSSLRRRNQQLDSNTLARDANGGRALAFWGAVDAFRWLGHCRVIMASWGWCERCLTHCFSVFERPYHRQRFICKWHLPGSTPWSPASRARSRNSSSTPHSSMVR